MQRPRWVVVVVVVVPTSLGSLGEGISLPQDRPWDLPLNGSGLNALLSLARPYVRVCVCAERRDAHEPRLALPGSFRRRVPPPGRPGGRRREQQPTLRARGGRGRPVGRVGGQQGGEGPSAAP